jgi:beta-glucanase (GH16 family)
MNRRMRARVGTAAAAAALTVLAACGGGGDDTKGAEETPTAQQKPGESLAPQPSDVPTAGAGKGDADADSPFASGAVPQSVAAGYALVWADEFEGSKLGPDWVFRDDTPPKRVCSPPNPNQVAVTDGTVALSVNRDTTKNPNVTKACPDGQFWNGFIATNGKQAFKYGVFAARLKFPPEQGAHGSFWMMPNTPAGADPNDPGEMGVEIDVIEYFGKGWEKGGLASFIHFQPQDGPRLRSGGYLQSAFDALGGGYPSDKFHVYSVEWTDKEYVFRVDGKETFRTAKGVSNVEEHLLLSLLSSDYEIPKITDDLLPMTMTVDWVRAWQK